ncbi:MAG: hypothetical protein U5R31_16275 [Acidimicrobiia bacterium]|nr:hypothetical protein [Acidimicrobiia bacterium]
MGLIGALLTGVSTCFPAGWSWTPPTLECRGDQGIIDAVLGPLTVGWKGGVGNHLVYGVFLGVFVLSTAISVVLAAFRDADPESLAEVAHTETPPVVEPPRHPSIWPFIGALAFGAMLVGLVVNTVLFMAGAFGVVLVGMEWTVRTWAENATGDPELNEEYRQRLAASLEVPGLATLVIGAFVMAGSRVFLAVSATGAVVIAGAVSFLLLIGFTLVAYYPRASRSVAGVFALLAGIIVIGSGIFSAAIGEREFEEHHHEDTEEVDDGGDEEEDGADEVPSGTEDDQ